MSLSVSCKIEPFDTDIWNGWLQADGDLSLYEVWQRHNPGVPKERFYESGVWKEQRREFLSLEGEVCDECGSTSNIHVHHVRGLNHDDLQALCGRCHAELHDKPELEHLALSCRNCHQRIFFRTPRKYRHAYNLDGTRHKCWRQEKA